MCDVVAKMFLNANGYTGNQLVYGEISKPIAATNTHYKRRLTLSALSLHATQFGVLFNWDVQTGEL